MREEKHVRFLLIAGNYADLRVSLRDGWQWIYMLLPTDAPLYYFHLMKKCIVLFSSHQTVYGSIALPSGDKGQFLSLSGGLL